MRTKLATLPVNRLTRYDAFVAAMESFREEFRLRCTAFNEEWGHAGFNVKFRQYDRLPFEKYETLLNGAHSSKTWLMGADVSSDIRRERLVFFFQRMSVPFIRALDRSPKIKTLPATDVSLVVSRWSEGLIHRLAGEPIHLREIAYWNGQLLFLVMTGVNRFEVKPLTAADAVAEFLADVIEAYL
jgi:hypothetical protein